ncbi:hypothetical protein QM806_04570 [Rhodococcus sp. IEGM 1351]|uniref:hypothetical protein n=1 Tax=Rhodococcus sp. IEGM 1351 TaxID=3047089 RepID=UPI0024B7ABF3|nr:hypothetical protein [Rhodococcus sp. IEGM 1351]MDI9934729.1 hypothetical protein [Rhodococcus sp. IEGM 1351]
MTIKEAIEQLDKMSDIYEEDYEKWDAEYYEKGITGVADILKNVSDDEYAYRGEWCVADDPSGETYINPVAYIEDGKPKIWQWVRENR